MENIEPIINVLDIGARAGIDFILPNWIPRRPMRYFKKNFRFFGIEPDPVEAENIERLEQYEKVFNLAISDICGERPLYLTKGRDKSSLLEPDLDVIGEWFTDEIKDYEIEQIINVNTTTVDSLLKNENIILDWIKVDTQGSEYEAILGATNSIKNTTVIITELSTVPQYMNQRTTVDFISEITKKGFDILLVNYKPIMSCENDIIFIKRLNSVNNLRQIFSLALCFSMVFMDDQKKILLDNIAPKFLSPVEIDEIRDRIRISENMCNENLNKITPILIKLMNFIKKL